MREDVIDAFWAAPTPVVDGVVLGSLRTLEPLNLRALAAAGVQHALILCSEQLVRSGRHLVHPSLIDP